MLEEYTISNAAAVEVSELIYEALSQGRMSFNSSLLAEVKIALDNADRIVIEQPKDN